MSNDLRHDKTCLNCGHEVPERYCSHCGQENTQPHETFGHLLHHFVADVVHYDSKFLTSVQYLLFRPGRLTKEYLAGKRVSYINPIRLYIFVSFIFFFTAFAIAKKDEEKGRTKHKTEKFHTKLLSEIDDSLQADLKKDSIEIPANGKLNFGALPSDSEANNSLINIGSAKENWQHFPNVDAYDSAQLTLPAAKRDTGFERWKSRRALYLKEKYNGADPSEIVTEIVQHQGPKVMFLLLPLFALLLKGVYNWKRWYYADHAIFSIHVHSFFFLLILVTLLIDRIFNTDEPNGWAFLLGFFYFVAALRNTYVQGWWKSFWKASLLFFGYSFMLAIVTAIFTVLALAVIM